jgi:hypothetical protein
MDSKEAASYLGVSRRQAPARSDAHDGHLYVLEREAGWAPVGGQVHRSLHRHAEVEPGVRASSGRALVPGRGSRQGGRRHGDRQPEH